MLTVFSRITHYGMVSFWRNGWLSTATVAIMTLALLMLISLILFGHVTTAASASIQDKIDITAYFKTNTPEDEILNIQQSLQSLPQVKSVQYVSQAQALQTFEQKHQNDATISSALNELNTNPLEASLNIQAQDPSQYGAIASYFSSNQSISQYVDSVSYSQNQTIIDRLNAIITNVNRGGLALTLVLALVACLVVFNTIRLAIYSNRDEISVMRVVGASNAFVRGPYMIEGIICGALAAVLSVIIMVPVVSIVSPYLDVFIPGLNLFQYFYTHIFSLFLYQLIFGIFLGGLSSLFAIRRYLRN